MTAASPLRPAQEVRQRMSRTKTPAGPARPPSRRDDQPRIQVTTINQEAAQRQYWRHVANRACLAILADARHPTLSAPSGSTSPTRGPEEPPRVSIGTDLYRVRVEPIEINGLETDRLDFDLLVRPRTPGNALTLATLLDWPTPETTEPLFRYRAHLQTLARREGLSGDMVYLFEMLLAPHAQDMLDAMSG